MRARDDLHLRQHVTEVLGVAAVAAARAACSRSAECVSVARSSTSSRPRLASALERARIDADPGRGHLAVDVVRHEQLAGVTPQLVERALLRAAWLSSVPSPSVTTHSPLWRT